MGAFHDHQSNGKEGDVLHFRHHHCLSLSFYGFLDVIFPPNFDP